MNARLFLSVALLPLAACDRQAGNPAPPRVDIAPAFPAGVSTIVVPLSAPLAAVEATLDREIPRELYRIDKQEPRCVPAQRVDIGIAKVKVTGDLSCRIVGQVTRGRIRLSGSGDALVIDLPVHAAISARKVGGVASETATGTASVRAVARLGIAGDWTPTAKVDIRYAWREPPGVDILGQRITFVEQADARLRPIVAKLERTLPRELAKLRLRDQLDAVWRQGFTTLSLNRADPPAWMRVTPRRLGFGGYRITGDRLELSLAAKAVTETFVGDRPADPAPTPLPPPSPAVEPRGLRFFIPVLADYRQLEPVVERALRRLAAKGITLPGLGAVDVRFGKVTIYATTDQHLAVGIPAEVRRIGSSDVETRGRVWLTAIPFNAPGSQLVQARDVRIAGDTDSDVADVLLDLFGDAGVQATIADGLSHDFAKDYAEVLADARRAIGSRQEGDFLLSATIANVRNGRLAVTGRGLFLPVEATGTATIAYRPR